MSGDVHVRFYERPWGRFPRATHPVIAFTSRRDAERVMAALPRRFAKHGLDIHVDKTRLLSFAPPEDRCGPSPRSSFRFLGFTHFWARSRKGNWG